MWIIKELQIERFNFQGGIEDAKNVLIMGGNSGIGYATAQLFLENMDMM